MSRNVTFTGNCLKIADSLYIPEDYREVWAIRLGCMGMSYGYGPAEVK